ncbi:LexA-binding, inner membrane-associated putative hydrolase [Candidatus Tiddalikarchaeum anstoanum]|nr:LexA-binding, inner membrane-associated putative hydrolase [Candidatus Tiddalikarchaeum anstoanum]
MNLLSHLFLGLTLGEILGLELFEAVLGSVVPDLDYLFGIEHRTFMHSLTLLLIIVLLFYKKNKRKVISFGITYSSHIMLDVLTTEGVQILWPFGGYYTYQFFNSLDLIPNLAVLIICAVLLLNKNLIREKLSEIKPATIRTTVYAALSAVILLSIPAYYLQLSSCKTASLNEVLINPGNYNEACIKTEGIICSEPDTYSSSSGNEYKIFNLCNDNSSVKVWMLTTITDLSLKENDQISLIGVFTTRYLNSSGYELYKIKNVNFSGQHN